MTATVHLLPQARTALPLLPERRRLVLDWLAVLETCGHVVVPDEVRDAVLDMCASPDLTPGQRADAWDGVQTWVELREGLEGGTYLPDVIGCTHRDEAEDTSRANAQDALSLFVNGPHTTARGSGITPRGNAS